MFTQQLRRVWCMSGRSNLRKLGLSLALIGILGVTTTEGAPTITSVVGEQVLDKRCTFAVEDVEKALAQAENASIPGSVVNVTDLIAGRLGNHFATAYRFLALGYCCKSKLVTLPPKDPILAPGIFGEGSAGPRHFDFSEALDVPGFEANACQEEYNIGGDDAYMAYLRTDDSPSGWSHNEPLTACIEKSRVLECEAAYYFPTDVDICDAYPAQESVRDNLNVAAEAGHLIIHVRSGDVFRSGHAYGPYGQPPLSYYTTILNSRQWERVDILTYARSTGEQNPVLPGLQVMIDTGSWSRTNISIYTEREIEIDLRAMLCADALATSRSTLGGLTMYHTRARTVYLPSTCDEERGDFGLTPKRLVNARAERENVEVIGIDLKPDAPPYQMYDVPQKRRQFKGARQSLEMLTYQGIAGLAVCS